MTAVSRKLLRRRDRDHRHFVWIGVCFGWEVETDAVEHALDLVADELALSDEGLRGRVNGLAVHVHEPPVVDVGGPKNLCHRAAGEGAAQDRSHGGFDAE